MSFIATQMAIYGIAAANFDARSIDVNNGDAISFKSVLNVQIIGLGDFGHKHQIGNRKVKLTSFNFSFFSFKCELFW